MQGWGKGATKENKYCSTLETGDHSMGRWSQSGLLRGQGTWIMAVLWLRTIQAQAFKIISSPHRGNSYKVFLFFNISVFEKDPARMDRTFHCHSEPKGDLEMLCKTMYLEESRCKCRCWFFSKMMKRVCGEVEKEKERKEMLTMKETFISHSSSDGLNCPLRMNAVGCSGSVQCLPFHPCPLHIWWSLCYNLWSLWFYHLCILCQHQCNQIWKVFLAPLIIKITTIENS